MVALKGLTLISCACWRSNALFYFLYSSKSFFSLCDRFAWVLCLQNMIWFVFFSFVYRNLNPISFGLRWLRRHINVSLMSSTMPILRFWRSYWLFDSLIRFGSLRLFPLSTSRLRKKSERTVLGVVAGALYSNEPNNSTNRSSEAQSNPTNQIQKDESWRFCEILNCRKSFCMHFPWDVTGEKKHQRTKTDQTIEKPMRSSVSRSALWETWVRHWRY